MAKKIGLSAEWHKSSYSNGSGGNNCVESRLVKQHDSVMIEVRDTKDPHSSSLMFTKAEWKAFVAGVNDGEFDIAD